MTGGHVDDSQNCMYETGYKECPYLGNADLLDDNKKEVILSQTAECVDAAAYEVQNLASIVYTAIRDTSYQKLYDV